MSGIIDKVLQFKYVNGFSAVPAKNCTYPTLFYQLGRCRQLRENTVNSRYSGHPRDRDLVSVIARVRNSGVQEIFILNIFTEGDHM